MASAFPTYRFLLRINCLLEIAVGPISVLARAQGMNLSAWYATPFPTSALNYVGFVTSIRPSYAVSASLNTDAREIISSIQASIRRAVTVRRGVNGYGSCSKRKRPFKVAHVRPRSQPQDKSEKQRNATVKSRCLGRVGAGSSGILKERCNSKSEIEFKFLTLLIAGSI